MTHDQMIEVIQAHRDGKAIEWRYPNGKLWQPYTNSTDPPTRFYDYEYRVKPQPVKRSEYRNVYAGGGIGAESYESRQMADICSASTRIGCVRVEFEYTPGQFDE